MQQNPESQIQQFFWLGIRNPGSEEHKVVEIWNAEGWDPESKTSVDFVTWSDSLMF